MGAHKKLKVDVPTLYRLWYSEMRNDELCEALGISRGNLWALRLRHSLPRRNKACRAPSGNESQRPDPTEAEIAERAAAIRRQWPAGEEERRRGGATPRWQMPCYAFDGRDVAFDAVVAMD